MKMKRPFDCHPHMLCVVRYIYRVRSFKWNMSHSLAVCMMNAMIGMLRDLWYAYMRMENIWIIKKNSYHRRAHTHSVGTLNSRIVSHHHHQIVSIWYVTMMSGVRVRMTVNYRHRISPDDLCERNSKREREKKTSAKGRWYHHCSGYLNLSLTLLPLWYNT